MKLIYLLVVTFIFSNLEAQRLSPSTKAIVKKLKQYEELSDIYRGISFDTAQQYHDYIKLRNTASSRELIKLLTDKNKIIKAYAGWALADTQYDKPAEILENYLKSGDSVMVYEGCLVDFKDIAGLFYYRFRYPDMGTVKTKSDTLYYLNNIKKLDSVLLYSGTESFLLKHALDNNNANPTTYKRIKELAITEKNDIAKIALAIYQKKEDIPDLIKQGAGSFVAISFFPHQNFWPFLVRQKDTAHSLEYFLAITSYKNDDALNLLEELYPKLVFDNMFALQEALTTHYCPLYQNILLKIWRKNRILNFTAAKMLVRYIPQQSSEAFVYGLLANDYYRFPTYNYMEDNLVLPLMLNTIEKYHPQLLHDVVNSNVILASRQQLEQFLDCAERNQLKGTADNIIKKLDYELIAYELFHLSKVLLSFKHADYNEKLLQKINKDKETWDWGNWSESYRELFKSYNISLD